MNTLNCCIIVPVYNAAKPLDRDKTVLHRCIDSIFESKFRDFELIVVMMEVKMNLASILDDMP